MPSQTPNKKPLLLDQVRQHLRLKHYSIRTEQAYVQFIKRFILFHHKRHPSEMGADEIRQYLSHLANEGRVSASTQNQALSALLFLYREVLGGEILSSKASSTPNAPRASPSSIPQKRPGASSRNSRARTL